MAGKIPRFFGDDILVGAAGSVTNDMLAAGCVTNDKVNAAAAIANTKLAAPNSYFTVTVSFKDLAAAGNDLREFQMPFAATLVEVCASVQTASGTAATVDVLESGVSVLESAIDVKTGAGTPQIGTITDSAIADNAVIGVKLTQTGDGATTGGFAMLTLKVAHCA
mgnify:CR=1 FL=1